MLKLIKNTWIIAVLAVTVFGGSSNNSLQAASFPCDNAKQPFAVVVCSDMELQGLDSSMGEKYKTLRDSLTGPPQLELIDNQVNWLNGIKTHCKIPETPPFAEDNIPSAALCLRGLYQKRLEALGHDQWHDPRAKFESTLTEETRIQLQQKMSGQGFYQDKLDGRFGPKFRKAVAKAQQNFNIKADGFVVEQFLSKFGVVANDGYKNLVSPSPVVPSPVPVPIAAPPAHVDGLRQIIQLGHSAAVTSVAFSSDGRFALSGSVDKTVKLWEVATGKEIRTFTGHSSSIHSVAFSPDGHLALSSGALPETEEQIKLDKPFKVWDVASGKVIRSFGEFPLFSSTFSPDGRLALSIYLDRITKMNAITLWDVTTGQKVLVFTGRSGFAESITFSPDSHFLLTGSETDYSGNNDKKMRLWDVATGKEVRAFAGGGGSVTFSPDGHLALSGSNDGIKLWDVATGKEIRTFKIKKNLSGGAAVAFTPDGQTVISTEDSKGDLEHGLVGNDTNLVLWETKTGKRIQTFECIQPSDATINAISCPLVTSIAVSPDGQTALVGLGPSGRYSASAANSLELLNLTTGKKIRSYRGYTDDLHSAAFHSDAQLALSADGYGIIKLWNLTLGEMIRSFERRDEFPINGITFSTDARQALSVYNGLRLWDVATGKAIQTFKKNPKCSGDMFSIAFSPDNKTAVTTGKFSAALCLWDVAKGQLIRTFNDRDWVLQAAFSPDGKTILSGQMEPPIGKLWDVKSGTEIRRFIGHSGSVNSVAFSPDGRFALSGSGDDPGYNPYVSGITDRTLKLWDVATGKPIRTFTGHATGPVSVVAFSPDGHFVLSAAYPPGGWDVATGKLELWDVVTGRLVRIFPGYSGTIHSLAFSKDGHLAYSGSVDGSLRVWDVASGQWIIRMIPTTDGEWSVDTPDGYYNTSPEGKSAVHYASSDETYSFEQFESLFRRPDIIRARLAGDLKAGTPAPALTRPPRVRATQVRGLNNNIASASYPLSVVASSQDDVVKTLRVFVNGKPTVEVPVDAKEKNLNLDVPLFAGPNRITAVAYDGKGFSSNQESIDLVSTVPGTQKPNLWVLSVGVSTYPKLAAQWQLDYAHSDANALVKALKEQRGKLFNDVHDVSLTNQAATPKAIEEGLSSLEGMNANDVGVIFMAGHGVQGKDGRFWFVTPEGSFDNPENGGVDWKALGEHLGRVKGRVILLLDACHSGSIVNETVVPNDELAARFFKGGLGGVMVFSASKGRQESMESPDIGGGFGAFTYALTQGLGPKAKEADRDGNGFVEFMELVDYVGKYVNNKTKGEQTPWLSRKELFGDLAIAVSRP